MSDAARTILVVDDDAAALRFLRSELESQGYKVVTAADAETGLALARELRPALIVTDLRLPGKDGFNLVLDLKRDPALAELPVLLTTADYGGGAFHQQVQSVIRDGRLLQSTSLVLKPVDGPTLKAQVSQLLDGKGDDAPRHILVVDDDPANLEMLEGRLNADGYAHTLVATGTDALDQVSARGFDAVLLDLRLPDMDGFQVLKGIRERGAHMPVLIMTAHGSEATAVNAIAAGAANYLIKPVGRRELATALKSAIERHAVDGERRRAEGQLLETVFALQQSLIGAERERRHLAGLLEALEEGVLVVAATGCVEWLNTAGQRMLGLTQQPTELEQVGRAIAAVLDEEGRSVDLEAAFGGRAASRDVEFVCRFKDGVERAFLVTSAPIFDEAGQLSSTSVVFRDTTDRRERRLRLETLLSELQNELADRSVQFEREVNEATATAERVKNEILSAVSHELRTPLNFIVGFGSVLADGLVGELTLEQQELLDKMLMGAERLTRTVEDLLDYAMLTSGMLTLTPEPIALNTLSRAIVQDMEPDARARGITLRLADGQDPPSDGLVKADFGYVGKVLRQLLSNALKFTPEGGTVDVTVTYDRPGREARWTVRDTGIGIAPAEIPRLFDRFYQVESHASRRFAGTGLGLALAKGLTDMMGATITVASQVGVGTSFEVTWPLPKTSSRPEVSPGSDSSTPST